MRLKFNLKIYIDINKMCDNKKKLCCYCNKPLKAIGNNRKNGRSFSSNNGNDWSSRQTHKKCYKILKEEQDFILFSNIYTEEQIIKRLEIFKEKYNLYKLL
jgi:hypothetical protein